MKTDKTQRDLFITIPADVDGREVNIPLTFEGLEIMAELILDKKSSDPIIEGIRTRRKWAQIKREYKILCKSMKSDAARRELSEKYHYSEKTIQSIIYER